MKTKADTDKKDDHDSPWKDMLEKYFFEFLEFFFPKAYQDIDLAKRYRFLDKELKQVVRDAKLGRRYADKLAEVCLKDGSRTWILIHVEIQGKREKQFSERMFVYNYRIFDKYRRTVVSFAVLADETEKWRPSDFSYGKWDCEMRLKFPVIKLTDYAEKWEELEKSSNPFAVAVMAHLKTLETKRNPGQRRYWKLCLCKGLYKRGYSRKDVLMLLEFIDWLMRLPKAAEKLFHDEMNNFEEEGKMRYVSSFRRFAMEEGLQKGLQQGIEQSIRNLLLNGITPEETARLLKADKKTVLKIAKEIRKESESKAA